MPVLTREQMIEKTKNKARALSTPALIMSLRQLDDQIAAERVKVQQTREYDHIQALNLTRSWVIGVIEERYPAAALAVEKAYDEAPEDADLDYDALLIAAIPENEK